MKVILLQNIKGFGRIGDIKNVSDGYARNMLFPKKMAKIADEGSAKEVEQMKAAREAQGQKELAQANATVTKLKDLTVEFKKKASPTGTLFSSVSKSEIAKEASRLTGFKLDESMLDLGDNGEHMKHVGLHQVAVELSPGLKTTLSVSIKS